MTAYLPAARAEGYVLSLGERVDGTLQPEGINAHGLVVGQARTGSDGSVRLSGSWDGVKFRKYKSPDEFGVHLTAINDAGVAVGFNGHALLWQRSGKPIDITTAFDLDPNLEYTVADINNKGTIVGHRGEKSFFFGPKLYYALMWRNGRVIDLDPEPCFCETHYSVPRAVNNHDVVAGYLLTEDFQYAFQWKLGVRTRLKTLDPDRFGAHKDRADDINDSGVIVGSGRRDGSLNVFATKWVNGQPVDLGTLPGYPQSRALGVNARADIVGASFVQDFYYERDMTATLWRGDGPPQDLNAFLTAADQAEWHLQIALKINDGGVITGAALKRSDGTVHAFLLSPVGR